MELRVEEFGTRTQGLDVVLELYPFPLHTLCVCVVYVCVYIHMGM